MIVESLAIICVVLSIAFVFLRARKTAYSYGILPLLIVPICKIATPFILPLLEFIQTEQINKEIGILLLGALIACILFGVVSAKFKTKRAKISYLCITALFTLILGMLFILDSLKV
jgi:hypothetical protein